MSPKRYPEADPKPDFAAIEKNVLEYWKQDGTFEAAVAARPTEVGGKSNAYVFYDGPPFANGLPHYGHLATGFVKDVIPRYRTMRGQRVPRRFGWDCHGLPAELEVEKEIGVSGRSAILEYGIENFNAQCRVSVLRFTRDWEWYVTRQARWVSFADSYKTMDLSYMESVMWAFKALWDKGLVYEGYRVVPYSWAVQTALSNFEARLDNSFRERDDPALTVAFTILPAAGEPAVKFLVWTTTPWTLPSNLALCVNPNLDYAVMRKEDKHLVLAMSALARYERELSGYQQVGVVRGATLVGRSYEALFPYFKDAPNAFRVIPGTFVSADEGTGIVHIAPGFGEDDLEVATAEGIPVVVPVDDAGRFTSEVTDYVGQNVITEGNPKIIADLKRRPGFVLRHEQVRHNYPHCWRTDTPLIYRAINAWYVRVSDFRDRMAELNRGIHWVPAHIRDGLFGNWLAHARDWNISRNRFWGAPIPVWKSDDPSHPRIDVYGSLDEIERDFGIRPNDLHRPHIDELVRPNPDDPTGRSMMRRVNDVLDCWFESGAMPFAQLHYPFENKELFEQNFPGDFIVEYVAQTRGWFYTLMVLSTALFDCAPFRNCVCHGVVLDEHNQKLSKRLRNYPDPTEVFETYGADALRGYMLASPLMEGGDLAMAKDGTDIAKWMRLIVIRLWNAYQFFTLYANIDGVEARFRPRPTALLDRYIVAKTRELIVCVQESLDRYDIPGAYAALPPFIEALNNWYIRGRRSTFWADQDPDDKQTAFDTLYTVLVLFCRATAPLMPLITEHIYRGLTGERSVHLTDWPDISMLKQEADLVREVDFAREICSSVLTLREANRRRIRLPLKTMTIAHPDAKILQPHLETIADEINVKSVCLVDDVGQFGVREVKVNSKIGARLGDKMKDILAAQRKKEWSLLSDGRLEIAGIVLEPTDFELRVKTSGELIAEPIDRWRGLVILDAHIYPDLQEEGWARDMVRLIQNARKQAQLNITDRIIVRADVPAKLRSALEKHAGSIRDQTLALELRFASPSARGFRVSEDIDGYEVEFTIERVAASSQF
jgi:isoleucyl-tRNA synthetase